MSAGPASTSLRKRGALYLWLPAVQTICVTILVFELMPLFWREPGFGDTDIKLAK